MDAIELHLPTNLVAPKLISADGSGPAGDLDSKESDHGGASLVARGRDIDRIPSCSDVKYTLSASDSCSVSRNKSSLERKAILPGTNSVCNGKRHNPDEPRMVLSLPKLDHKTLSKRSIKILSSFPCSKRPKIEQGLSGIVNPEDHDVMSMKIGSSLKPCTLSEKSLLVKPKRGHDVKRADKKNLRACFRAKYDCFTSKSGFTNCDLAMGGNKIFGPYGLKTDIHDLGKHMEELSLNQLLDGSYRYSNVCGDKGKKALNLKEDLLFSIRKVCSILPLGVLDGSASRKDAASLENMTDHDDKDKCRDESTSTRKDLSKASSSNSVLYQPKDVLERLALSPGQDLDSLLQASSGVTSAPPLQSSIHCSLPSFPWSHSQSGAGAHRPSVDPSKVASTRNCSQGQWIRVGINLNVEGEEHCFLPEFELGKLDEIESSKSSGMIDNLTCDVESLDYLDNQMKSSNTEDCLQKTSESDFTLRFLHNHPEVMDPLEHKLPHNEFEVAGKKQCSGGKHSSYCCHGNPCGTVNSASGRTSSHMSTPDISKPGHSPIMLRAAEILCEMASSSDTTMPLRSSSGAIKWPNSPSQKTMKARKPLPSFVIEDSSSFVARHPDIVRSKATKSLKHKLAERGPIRWPVPVADEASPSKSERSPVINARQLQDNVTRHSSHLSSEARIEKDYEHQQKLRKATLTASLGFGGTYTGVWNRQRSRRG